MDDTSPNCVTFLLRRRAADPRSRFAASSAQRWTLIAASATFTLGIAAGLAFKMFHAIPSAQPALALLLLTQLLAAASMIAVMLPDLKALKDLNRTVARPIEEAFHSDLGTIQGLAYYPRHELEHAKDQFERGARRLRERSALLVGALDKVGILPLGLTAYLTFSQVIRDGFDVGPLAWVSFGIAGVYLLATRAVQVAQWMEQAATLFGRAIELQRPGAAPMH